MDTNNANEVKVPEAPCHMSADEASAWQSGYEAGYEASDQIVVPSKFASLKLLVDQYVEEDSKESGWSNSKLNMLQREISQKAHPKVLQELFLMLAASSLEKEPK